MGNACKENTKVDRGEEINNSWGGNANNKNYNNRKNYSERNVGNQGNGIIFGSKETFEFGGQGTHYKIREHNFPNEMDDQNRYTFAPNNNNKRIFGDRGDIDNFQPKEKMVSSHLFIKDDKELNEFDYKNKKNDFQNLKNSNFKEFFNRKDEKKKEVKKNNMMYDSRQLEENMHNSQRNGKQHANIKVSLNKNRGGIRQSNFGDLPDYNDNDNYNYKESQFGQNLERNDEKENNDYVILSNGAKYTGNMKYGIPEGKGKEVFKNGDFFEGNYAFGKREGEGKLEKKNEYVYIGNFKNGIFQGSGKKIFENGNVFEGTFNNDLEDGHGILKDKRNVIIKEGEWIKGNFIG